MANNGINLTNQTSQTKDIASDSIGEFDKLFFSLEKRETKDLDSALINFFKKKIKISPTGENKFLKCKYATKSDIVKAISEPLAESGIVVENNTLYHPVLGWVFVTYVIHSESQQYKCAYLPSFGKTIQELGGSCTYLGRYNIINLLNLEISDETEDDGENLKGAGFTPQINNQQQNNNNPYDGQKPKGVSSAQIKKNWSNIKEDIEACETLDSLQDIWTRYSIELREIKNFDQQSFDTLENSKEEMKKLIKKELAEKEKPTSEKPNQNQTSDSLDDEIPDFGSKS